MFLMLVLVLLLLMTGHGEEVEYRGKEIKIQKLVVVGSDIHFIPRLAEWPFNHATASQYVPPAILFIHNTPYMLHTLTSRPIRPKVSRK